MGADHIVTLLAIATVMGLIFLIIGGRQRRERQRLPIEDGYWDHSRGKTLIRPKEEKKEKPNVKFDDIAGIDEAKEELMEIVDFLRNTKKFGRLGGKIPKGALLVGPPGVGKTLLAKAVAGEAEVNFEDISASEFVEMYVGIGAKHVRELFIRARKQAPCIIFIDEIDAIGKRKSSGGGGETEYNQTINQILTEMDGFRPNKGIIVMAATNRLDQLDDAILRPGRFDRIVHIHLPDIKGREEILKIHSRPPIILSPTVDLRSIARTTAGFSGAELANLMNEAALDAERTNKDAIYPEDFETAKDKIRLGKENKSLSSVMTEEEKRIIAYHEAGHAIVAVEMPESDPLYKVSIIPRGQALGVTTLMPEKDRYNNSKDYLEELLCMLLGGRIAEEIIFGKITTGAQNDIEKVTAIAREMVCTYGMTRLGLINLRFSFENPLSEVTKREVDAAIREIIDRAANKSRDILKRRKAQLDRLASALLEKETLTRDEIEIILKEPQ